MRPAPEASTVLFLHPGSMGAKMAGECRAASRLWVDGGRSDATAERAEAEGLEAVGDLAEATARADLVVSICPPAAAIEVAEQVAATAYDGLYLDANAVSPATMAWVVAAFDRQAGPQPATVIDGGVIGPPPGTPGTTRLYLAAAGPVASRSGRFGAGSLTTPSSGSNGTNNDNNDNNDASWVASLWAGSNLDAVVIGGLMGGAIGGAEPPPFAASALKMSYAAWTKGSAALLLSVVAAASQLGVADLLAAEWALSQPGLAQRAEHTAAGVGPKAWRFAGEMGEIAATVADTGAPAGFWIAAAEAYDRLTPFRSDIVGPSSPLDAAIALLLSAPGPIDDQADEADDGTVEEP